MTERLLRHRTTNGLLLALVALLAVALLAVALLAVADSARATPVFTEPGFESTTLASGLDLPTDVAWAPDGRMFIAEKEGYVRVVEANGTLLANPIVDIHDHVIPYGDRGLIGIAVAPVKEGEVTLYLLYDHGSPVGASTETIATATLTSVRVHANNEVVGPKGAVDPTETTILGSVNSPGTTYGSACASENIDCIPADGFTHSIGTVLVDPKDGSLWVGSGDGLNDFGDEPGGVAGPLHIRAQNPNSLAGKILHVHANGEGFANSPFCPSDANLKDNCTKVWGMGFRNPFRFTLRQLSGETVPVVGDVGEGHWEKLDLLNSRGFNAGWPCYEGNQENPDFAKTTQCETLGTSYNKPLFVYTHYSDECTYPGAPAECDKNQLGAAIAATTIYEGGQPGFEYPATYLGRLFIADYVHGWISAVNMAEPPTLGISNGSGMPLFAQHLGELVDSSQAPNGDLVYVTLSVESETALGFGTVQEIRYMPADKAPVAVPVAASSCIDSSTTPRRVSFMGDDSYDPDGDTSLAYHWDFGDGASSNVANPEHEYAGDGNYEARLTVTDGKGNSASGFLAIHIKAGQSGQPAADIKFPEPSRQYIAGVYVSLSGDNKTAGARSQWQVVRYDGSNILAATPPVETGTEGSSEFQTDPSPPSDRNYVLHFVSSNGTCTTTVGDTLQPQIGQLNLKAQDQAGNPLPVPLTFAANQPGPAPLQLMVVKNMVGNLAAPQTFNFGGSTYEFERWSDERGREHALRVFEYPAHASEEVEGVTAIYKKLPPPPPPPPPLPSELITPTPPTPPSPPVAGKPRVTLNHFKARPSSLSGTVADSVAVRSLRLAIRPLHLTGRGCTWWSAKRRALVHTRQGCARVSWLNALLSASGSTTGWRLSLGAHLPAGRYRLLISAIDVSGGTASSFAGGISPSGVLTVH